MGVLRSDRVSGLGGANAINGSVFFGRNGVPATASGNWLTVSSEDDFKFGTGDFTIEAWIYYTGTTASSNSGWFQISNTVDGINNSNTASAGGLAGDFEAGAIKGIGNNGWFNGTVSVTAQSWIHVALVRHSGTLQWFVNGAADTSASDSQDYSLTHLAIGGYYTTSYLFSGYISNFRVQKGKAEYSAAFTPPTTRLERTPETVVLACQSSGNILQEATGKTFAVRKINSNDAPPMASRFTPDKGEDHGTTFGENTVFDTLSYMVPPGGTTTQSNRGRGLFAGGYAPSPNSLRNIIDYVQIQSQGNAIDFGDLLAINNGESGACSSSTRALYGGGQSNLVDITYVTIATTSNATDFGDLLTGRRSLTAVSNSTRGLFAGGTTPTMKNEIEYVTIASIGNATDFGDLTVGRRNMAPNSSPTRGVFAGGNPGSGPLLDDTIDYVTIASAGNATDFGNMTQAMREIAGSSSSTRGLIAGGYVSPANINNIEYITIATTGNATDFGDLHTAVSGLSGTSNGTRGVFAGGSYINNIQYVTIATTGNASDFGDLTAPRMLYDGTSDSHGGIS